MFSSLSFCQNSLTKLLHAYVQCVHIVKTKYDIAESKAVVGVDQPYCTINACIKAILWENCLSSHSCNFVIFLLLNQTHACICSKRLHCIAKYQTAPSKAVVGVDRPVKALYMHIKKPNLEKNV